MGGLCVIVEVEGLCLCLHVLACSVVIDSRDGDLRQYIFLIIREAQGSPQCASVNDIAAACVASAVHQQTALKRTRELYPEIDLAEFCPTGHDTEALDGRIIDDAYLALDDLISASPGIIRVTAEGHAVEVENDGLLLAFGERVLMDAGMNGCRKFDVDVLAAK